MPTPNQSPLFYVAIALALGIALGQGPASFLPGLSGALVIVLFIKRSDLNFLKTVFH
jgi:hypothetical protein